MKTPDEPRHIPQVMISSTFTDLKEHRAALIDAVNKHKLHPNVMEYDDAKLVDVIDSSLQMVRDSAAYICVIGFKYGQIPSSPDRNRDELSITELEFNEAQAHNRPILLFIMGEAHPVTKADIERDPDKERKLDAFRERAKKALPGSSVNRVYAAFNSLEEFKDKIASSLSELVQHLQITARDDDEVAAQPKDALATIPKPPALYAEPPYIGSHEFIGRDSQLQELTDWAKPADPTNLLLFEAIGGNGKSMLTWEWTTNPKYAVAARSGEEAWAGCFWYSFYEKGAVMADFCQRAIAYMTEERLEELRKKKTAELKEPLLAQLKARPWLLILDGLERVLVAYHRIDAAEVPDEEANSPTDKIVSRNPRDAIRDEDNDLLRALAAAKPSKILVSSRLTPRVLLNPSDQPINGVKRISLPGLRPPDAEKLLRSCGIEGGSAAIQSYLAANCDNHPLVIGVLAGLIRNYLPARGDFDAWAVKEDAGAKLDLASLNLIQRRNHILRAAFDALSPTSRQLLSTLALVPESVDYETLEAFNPHIPAKPAHDAVQRHEGYPRALADWKVIASSLTARTRLQETVRDLETRGLLQFDDRTNRYDLHPVVRGAASGLQRTDEKEVHGERVIDHFSSMPHRPYEEAESLEDLTPRLNVVRTLLKLGRFQQATDAYVGELARALLFNVEAYAEVLSLLRPFFPYGWQKLPRGLRTSDAYYLANDVAIALGDFESREALAIHGAILIHRVEMKQWENANTSLRNIAGCLRDLNLLAKATRVDALALDLATRCGQLQPLFMSRLWVFKDLVLIGQWAEAETVWQLLDPMGRRWNRAVYRLGMAEYDFARFQFFRGDLQEKHLDAAERLAAKDKNHNTVRDIYWLRGAWLLERGEWKQAAASFQEAARMARALGVTDSTLETGLALAKYRLGQLAEPQRELERLAQLREPSHRYLAQLWLALGDTAQAKRHALAAYTRAWTDGEPYVHRYSLSKATELLQQMNLPNPDLPPYDPANDEPFPWEADVRAAIQKL